MMKKLLFTLTAIVLALAVTAQNELTLSWDGELLDKEVNVYGNPSDQEIEFNAIINNTTGNGMNVKVIKNEMMMHSNTKSSFKWGSQNYPPATNESDYLLIKAGESTSVGTFIGRYQPNNGIGVSVVEYTFLNIDDANINAKVVVKYYTSPQSIGDETLTVISLSSVYPNPAKNIVNLDYSFTTQTNKASAKVFNLLGKVVKEVNIVSSEGKLKMDISDLDNGFYFFSVFVNGEVYQTRKLIVQH